MTSRGVLPNGDRLTAAGDSGGAPAAGAGLGFAGFDSAGGVGLAGVVTPEHYRIRRRDGGGWGRRPGQGHPRPCRDTRDLVETPATWSRHPPPERPAVAPGGIASESGWARTGEERPKAPEGKPGPPPSAEQPPEGFHVAAPAADLLSFDQLGPHVGDDALDLVSVLPDP